LNLNDNVKVAGANSRPASALDAGRQFERASWAPPSLSAAVAQFCRWAAIAYRRLFNPFATMKPLLTILIVSLGFRAALSADTSTILFPSPKGIITPIRAWTNGLSFERQGAHEILHWEMTDERILATPGWDPETQPIPLAPDKAIQIARAWLKTHGYKEYDLLESIEILRYPNNSGRERERLKRRYYYKLQFSFNFRDHRPVVVIGSGMPVYILMDGSVLELTKVPIASAKK
jgi:hypothetical protein